MTVPGVQRTTLTLIIMAYTRNSEAQGHSLTLHHEDLLKFVNSKNIQTNMTDKIIK
jgi:hypothetical protein